MDSEQWAAMAARVEAEREAARETARARGEEYATVLSDIGWDVGAPMPHVFSSGLRTFVFLPGLERRVLRPLVPEVRERPLQVAQSLLQRN
ncbi:hypothetical protein, partial [Kitasatospora sp. NPDC047058]|uniref:hypothetical protein n=1 Tax=Kitasatospora sp. NPDC047058 TaxID=3155620 RepID=UPI0033CE687A